MAQYSTRRFHSHSIQCASVPSLLQRPSPGKNMELLLTCLLALGLFSPSLFEVVVAALVDDVVVVVVVVVDVVDDDERSDFRWGINFQAFFKMTSESGSRPSGTKACDHLKK